LDVGSNPAPTSKFRSRFRHTKMICTKEYCTLEDFKFEWEILEHGCYSIKNYQEYLTECRKPEHYFCSPVKTKKRNQEPNETRKIDRINSKTDGNFT
jgi:hypothetical protein